VIFSRTDAQPQAFAKKELSEKPLAGQLATLVVEQRACPMNSTLDRSGWEMESEIVMEAQNIGGVLAGGLVANALLYKLIDKGILSADDAKGVLQSARKAIGFGHVMTLQDKAAAEVLDSLIARFPEGGFT